MYPAANRKNSNVQKSYKWQEAEKRLRYLGCVHIPRRLFMLIKREKVPPPK